MSVVAAKKFPDRIEIGADHQVTEGWRKRIYDEPKKENPQQIRECKLTKIEDDWIFGTVGWMRDHFFMQRFVQTHKPSYDDEDSMTAFYHEYIDYVLGQTKNAFNVNYTDFLMVYEYNIYVLASYTARLVETYEAIGSGSDYALGVLYALPDESSIRPALMAACRLDLYCHEPLTIHTVSIVNGNENGEENDPSSEN